MVAAIIRTSTFNVRVLPSRSNSCSWRTRRILAWKSSDLYDRLAFEVISLPALFVAAGLTLSAIALRCLTSPALRGIRAQDAAPQAG